MLHLEHLVWWEGWLSSETSDSSHLVSQPASSSAPRHLKLVAVIVSLTSFGGTLLNWAWLLATQNHIQQSFSKPLWRNSDLFKSIKLGSLKKFSSPLIFSTHDELLTSGAKIEKLIVAPPALDRPVEVQILYIAYEGWIYSGRWEELDKIKISSSTLHW